MESDKLALLLKTVDLGSLSKAAAAMGYTQSAASYAIQSLEDELGVSMLHRSKRGMQLTTDGAFLISYVRDCVSSVNKLRSTAHFIQGVQIGVLRVAAFSSVSMTYLPEIIHRFHTSFPNIVIDIISGTGRYAEMEEFLLNGQVDCSFVSLPASAKLHCDELLSDQLYAIIPLDHPLAKRPGVISFSELEELPFIMPADGKNEEIQHICKEYNFVPNVAFTMYDDLSILGMVENGLGCTIASELILTHFHYRVAIKELSAHPHRVIGLAVRAGEESSPLLSAFLDTVKQTFSSVDSSFAKNRLSAHHAASNSEYAGSVENGI